MGLRVVQPTQMGLLLTALRSFCPVHGLLCPVLHHLPYSTVFWCAWVLTILRNAAMRNAASALLLLALSPARRFQR